MKIKFNDIFNSLGTTKKQRSFRLFLIIILFLFMTSAIIIYGFKSSSIKVNVGVHDSVEK